MLPVGAPLIEMRGAQIVRGQRPILPDLTWTLRAGQTWAIVGPIAAGKTTLAETLQGKHRVTAGSITWPLLEYMRRQGRDVAFPSEVIRRVSFKEQSNLFSYTRHYYQQRFNFIEAEDDLTLDAFLRANRPVAEEVIQAIAAQFAIDPLRTRSLIKLSNGQMRRARLARAVLAQPALLILDEPFMGLDRAGREAFAALLKELHTQGTHLVLITRPDTLPDWISHVLELEIGVVHWQGPRANYQPEVLEPASPTIPPTNTADAPVVIELEDITVKYENVFILNDLSWTVRQGDRWAVFGPNGAGKSTLLSLLCGDHPQAYANSVRLFGRQRGTGESIWEVKAKIGLLSPELHLYFREPLSAAQTAATGFHDVLVARPMTAEQRERIRELFASFGILPLWDRPFAALSTGEQRLVLFARALVKQPALLILDEPFQGLDLPTIRRLRAWLETQLSTEQTLLFVTHFAEEIPATVTHWLRLTTPASQRGTPSLSSDSPTRELGMSRRGPQA